MNRPSSPSSLRLNEMVNDIIQHEQHSCALFFVRPPTCSALVDCVEPAIWCWHESCPYPVPADPCIINETTVYYCSCSAIPPNLMVATSADFQQSYTTARSTNTGGLPTSALVSIVVISLLIAAALLALLVWIFIKYKRRRKLEGRYCPAVEEEKSAVKNLPPLPPPSIEGLI